LNEPRDAPMHTRFKMWWRLIGSAVEHAAKLHGNSVPPNETADQSAGRLAYRDVDFRALFQLQDDDDDDTSLAEALEALEASFQEKLLSNTTLHRAFDAKELCKEVLNGFDHPWRSVLREFFCPKLSAEHHATPKSVGRALTGHVGEVVQSGVRTLVLKSERDQKTKILAYQVKDVTHAAPVQS